MPATPAQNRAPLPFRPAQMIVPFAPSQSITPESVSSGQWSTPQQPTPTQEDPPFHKFNCEVNLKKFANGKISRTAIGDPLALECNNKNSLRTKLCDYVETRIEHQDKIVYETGVV